MLKDICAWLVGLTGIMFVSRYVYQVWKREISPALSTWIIFLLGTGLSLATYAIAEKHDFRSGILNTVDFLQVLTALIAVIIWGKHNVRFKPFEKWYLVGIAAVVVYGIISGDAWGSNIFTQVLICIGYAPTIQNMIVEKRNTESFTAWGVGILAGFFALYPAISGGNSLAVLYSVRTIVLVSAMLALMAYFKLHSKRKKM